MANCYKCRTGTCLACVCGCAGRACSSCKSPNCNNKVSPYYLCMYIYRSSCVSVCLSHESTSIDLAFVDLSPFDVTAVNVSQALAKATSSTAEQLSIFFWLVSLVPSIATYWCVQLVRINLVLFVLYVPTKFSTCKDGQLL